MKLHPASRWHALYVFTHLGATRMWHVYRMLLFHFLNQNLELAASRSWTFLSNLLSPATPGGFRGSFFVVVGWNATTNPCGLAPPKKKGENNKIGKGKMKEIKREKKLTTENKATFWEKRWGWRGLKKQKEDEWKPHAKQEDLENICTYITK